MLRKTLISLAAISFGIALLACQTDVTEPNFAPSYETTDDLGAIRGYVKQTDGVYISGATVTWYDVVSLEILGTDDTNNGGFYIINAEPWWENYDGNLIEGIATHPEYQDAYNQIGNFNHGSWYWRGFEMEEAK